MGIRGRFAYRPSYLKRLCVHKCEKIWNASLDQTCTHTQAYAYARAQTRMRKKRTHTHTHTHSLKLSYFWKLEEEFLSSFPSFVVVALSIIHLCCSSSSSCFFPSCLHVFHAGQNSTAVLYVRWRYVSVRTCLPKLLCRRKG